MSLTVCKFGGSSLADGNNIARAADGESQRRTRRSIASSLR